MVSDPNKTIFSNENIEKNESLCDFNLKRNRSIKRVMERLFRRSYRVWRKDIYPIGYHLKKQLCTIPWIRKQHIRLLRVQQSYQSLYAQEPLVSKMEEFIADEFLTTMIQAFYGDDLGIYVSNNMLSYYANRISYTLSLILRDLSFKNVLHNMVPNSLLIVFISYSIAFICILIEAEKL